MDLANDHRVRHLTEQIQHEPDQAKLLELVNELCRILDDHKAGKPAESKR
jgi:hypothetical protein